MHAMHNSLHPPVQGIHTVQARPWTIHCRLAIMTQPQKEQRYRDRHKHQCDSDRVDLSVCTSMHDIQEAAVRNEQLQKLKEYIIRDGLHKNKMWNEAYKNIGPSSMSWP